MSTSGFYLLKNDYSFKTLIDIGANNGVYGKFLRRFFSIDKVIAFEPLEIHRQTLLGLGFDTHTVALSNENSFSELNITLADAASSLLTTAEITKEEWGEAVSNVGTQSVKTCKLDDIIDGDLRHDVIIKVDAQGLEPEIIDGGRETFEKSSCVLIEVSFVPLDDGQGLFQDVHSRMTKLGFILSGIKNQTNAKIDGRPLFAHCIYTKTK